MGLSGTGRDDLIVWDPAQLWIYEAAGAGRGGPAHRPKRPPLHSWSNYMCYWSLPGRSDGDGGKQERVS